MGEKADSCPPCASRPWSWRPHHLSVFRAGVGSRLSPLPPAGSAWTWQRVQGTQPAPCPPGSLEIGHFRRVRRRVLSRCGSCGPVGQTPPLMHLEGSPESLE